ncbi:S-layer homology domain-containing protein [Candidatus Epulonipiscium viviparus]|uniref:S-layer homology domain-containing protein n=1 Tax=Candidatus Epulonipiscium viviparus TaxID=420336 RepID=UPI00273808E4|nr:S-layer homology domain-containing protein [Candidatus Epulopiscium viviparus]
MIKKISFLLTVAILLQPLSIQATNTFIEIDDPYLLEELLQNADKNHNGYIEQVEALNLNKLQLDNLYVTDIRPLKHFPNLTSIVTQRHSITDISALASLSNLTYLDLKNDTKSSTKPGITNISPLRNLTNLTYLNLSNNNISDLRPLSNLTGLKNLLLEDNNISLVYPISNLTELTIINIKNNPVSDYMSLSNLTGLKRLYLDDDKITLADEIALINTGINVYTVTPKPDSKDEFVVEIPMDNIDLPYNQLDHIENRDQAVSVMEDIVDNLSAVQKEDRQVTEMVATYAEEAVIQVASKSINRNELINYDLVVDLEAEANQTAAALEDTIANGGIELNRELDRNVLLTAIEDLTTVITLDTSLAQSQGIDNLRVETKDVDLELNMDDFKKENWTEPLKITLEQKGSGVQGDSTNYNNTSYAISYSPKMPEKPITIGLPKTVGDLNYQAAFRNNELVGGKYNPATDKIEMQSNLEGDFIVAENYQNFTDIANKSVQMQEAIKMLVSKGIMDSNTATEFGPDDAVTRAEIATMLVKIIYAYDLTADGGYIDVFPTDWFHAGVGSATNEGIMEGYQDNTFKPNSLVLKDEAISVIARVLQMEKGYSTPSNITDYLSQYVDAKDIPAWAAADIAFATRENLIMRRTDGMFLPSSVMTKGEIAMILKKLFDRIG